MLDHFVTPARAALSRGDVLIAYDEAKTAIETDPDDLDARYVGALALARCGAIERARAVTSELLALYEAVAVKYGGFFASINAASMALLAGDLERGRRFAPRADTRTTTVHATHQRRTAPSFRALGRNLAASHASAGAGAR